MTATPAKYIYMNGEIVPFADAKIHVLSVGLTYAATVFEGLRGYWNDADQEIYLFRLEPHIKRLRESMKMLRMDNPPSDEQIRESVFELVKANKFHEDVHIRQMAIIEGTGPIGTTGPVGLSVVALPSYRHFDPEKGLNCAISSWRRISDESVPPRIKCVANYQNSRHAFLQAKQDGYDNVILLNKNGKVSEGPTMCIFLVRNGEVITPLLTNDVLESITRDTVIQLLKEYHGVDVIQREVDRTELYTADEAFFCGTACEVTPIVSVDRHNVGDGKMGELTRKIQKTYIDIARGTSRDHTEWRTGVYGK
ncbi:MAG: branched-chain amino acid transaminase [Armatimonadetes bacterium]|nr:branched-chain amino acid transaminase [Armatimonadota bacterium]